jgi:hypothetical protein
MSRPSPTQHAFARALLDTAQPAPAGLVAWNGADVGVRLAVHRNNVVVSLVGVLADTYPVVRRLVGDEFFDAMARLHVCEHPPASPVMSEYGADFADWIAGFEPAAALPYLADMARLERARVTAYHAADAPPLDADALARCLDDPARLPSLRLALHPSLSVHASAHAVVSLWAAHQGDDDDAIGRVNLQRAESAVVLRQGDEVLVLPAAPADAMFVEQLRCGICLGDAAAAAPGADLTRVLGLILQHGALVAAFTGRTT